MVRSRVGVVLLSHVRNAEDESEQHAQGAHHDVANGQEVVLASEGVRCRQHEVLSALEWRYLELVVDLDFVLSWLESILDFTPKLSEVRQTGSSHPDDEVLYWIKTLEKLKKSTYHSAYLTTGYPCRI